MAHSSAAAAIVAREYENVSARLDALRTRALHESRRRKHGLYFHGTSYWRDPSIRRDGIRRQARTPNQADEPDGPYLALKPRGAWAVGVRDLWRTRSDDHRCIVYAVRAPDDALETHSHGWLERHVTTGRIPAKWIVAHEVFDVPPAVSRASGDLFTIGIRQSVSERVSDRVERESTIAQLVAVYCGCAPSA